jgi:ABC-2 type transport system permease protein
MKPFAIARVNVVRMLRDREGLFFVFALPMVIVVVLGLAFGGAGTRELGVADVDGGPFATELAAAIEANRGPLEIRRFASIEALRDAVQRNQVDMGLAVPAGFDAALREGRTASVEYVSRPGEPISSAIRLLLDDAVGRQAATVEAARFASLQRGITFDEALADARRLAAVVGSVGVLGETRGEAVADESIDMYGIGAQSQVVLFVFLTSMTAASQLIVTRQLGLSRRMLSTPTSVRSILLGETMGRFAVALIQGLFIYLATAIVFRVAWGDPVAAVVVIVVFGLVATGAAMLVGSIATNAEQASSIGVGLAMLLAAFGGAMVPPEIFPEVMRTVSYATPHAWAIDALRSVAIDDAGLGAILPQLGVLVAYAAVLLTVAIVLFRRSLVGSR